MVTRNQATATDYYISEGDVSTTEPEDGASIVLRVDHIFGSIQITCRGDEDGELGKPAYEVDTWHTIARELAAALVKQAERGGYDRP